MRRTRWLRVAESILTVTLPPAGIGRFKTMVAGGETGTLLMDVMKVLT